MNSSIISRRTAAKYLIEGRCVLQRWNPRGEPIADRTTLPRSGITDHTCSTACLQSTPPRWYYVLTDIQHQKVYHTPID